MITAPNLVVPFADTELLYQKLTALIPPATAHIAIAVSGGIDSVSLMLLTWQWQQLHRPNLHIVVLTVDHQLRPTSSIEAEYVRDLAAALGLEAYIFTWQHTQTAAEMSNLEAQAREARYGFLVDFCHQHQIQHLLLAHHQQDQAETLLIRLFRGSGIEGLASMQESREVYGLTFVRPLLACRKEDCEQFLLANQVRWYEDESNHNGTFLRNDIRRFLQSLPHREEILKKINTSIEHINSVKDIIDDYVLHIKDAVYQHVETYGYFYIYKSALTAYHQNILTHILAHILMQVSGNYYKPRRANLLALLQTLSQTQPPKRCSFYGCILENYDDTRLLIYREYHAIQETADIILQPGQTYHWDRRRYVTASTQALKLHKLTIQELNQQLSAIKHGSMPSPYPQDWLSKLQQRSCFRQIQCTLPLCTIV